MTSWTNERVGQSAGSAPGFRSSVNGIAINFISDIVELHAQEVEAFKRDKASLQRKITDLEQLVSSLKSALARKNETGDREQHGMDVDYGEADVENRSCHGRESQLYWEKKYMELYEEHCIYKERVRKRSLEWNLVKENIEEQRRRKIHNTSDIPETRNAELESLTPLTPTPSVSTLNQRGQTLPQERNSQYGGRTGEDNVHVSLRDNCSSLNDRSGDSNRTRIKLARNKQQIEISRGSSTDDTDKADELGSSDDSNPKGTKTKRKRLHQRSDTSLANEGIDSGGLVTTEEQPSRSRILLPRKVRSDHHTGFMDADSSNDKIKLIHQKLGLDMESSPTDKINLIYHTLGLDMEKADQVPGMETNKVIQREVSRDQAMDTDKESVGGGSSTYVMSQSFPPFSKRDFEFTLNPGNTLDESDIGDTPKGSFTNIHCEITKDTLDDDTTWANGQGYPLNTFMSDFSKDTVVTSQETRLTDQCDAHIMTLSMDTQPDHSANFEPVDELPSFGSDESESILSPLNKAALQQPVRLDVRDTHEDEAHLENHPEISRFASVPMKETLRGSRSARPKSPLKDTSKLRNRDITSYFYKRQSSPEDMSPMSTSSAVSKRRKMDTDFGTDRQKVRTRGSKGQMKAELDFYDGDDDNKFDLNSNRSRKSSPSKKRPLVDNVRNPDSEVTTVLKKSDNARRSPAKERDTPKRQANAIIRDQQRRTPSQRVLAGDLLDLDNLRADQEAEEASQMTHFSPSTVAERALTNRGEFSPLTQRDSRPRSVSGGPSGSPNLIIHDTDDLDRHEDVVAHSLSSSPPDLPDIFAPPERPGSRWKVKSKQQDEQKRYESTKDDRFVGAMSDNEEMDVVIVDDDDQPKGPKENVNTVIRSPKKNDVPNYKYVEVVRKKDDRRKMHGTDCDCCRKFYEITGPLPIPDGEWHPRMRTPSPGREKTSEELLEERVNRVSRHRHHHKPPSTPPDYWDVEFPDTQKVAGWKKQKEEAAIKKSSGGGSGGKSGR